MTDVDQNLVLISGSSNPHFANKIASHLNIPLGKIELGTFPDGEISVQILESVRGKDVYVVQTIALKPNEYLMELLVIIDALKRASARKVIAVVPYFGYCRQDRKDQSRVPITAKLIANLLETAGIDRLLTMDLHAGQLQGFFDVPVDNLLSMPLLAKALKERDIEDLVVAAPDVGSIKLARNFASLLKSDLVVIDKVRKGASDVEVTTLIGDIQGKSVLLADDICSTGGTLASAAKACREKGAKRVFACVTHGIFVGPAVKRVEESPIEALLMTDTIPFDHRFEGSDKFHVVSVAGHFAEVILCISQAKSIHSLYSY